MTDDVIACRVGIWDAGPALHFRWADLPTFESRGFALLGGRPLSMTVSRSRIVMQASECTGRHLQRCFENSPLDWGFMATFETAYEVRCGLFDTMASWGGTDDVPTLTVKIPAPHLLPYPTVNFHTDAGKKDMVLRDIRARLDSAKRHGGRFTVDAEYQRFLTPAERVRLHTCPESF